MRTKKTRTPPSGSSPTERPGLLRRLSDSTGANLLEAALVTPLLLLLTFSIIDFAAIFYVYLALENGVSQATRYAVTGNQMDDPDNPGEQLGRADSIKAAMREATPTLTIEDDAFTFSHMAPGGAWVSGTGGPSDIEKVTVTYTWTPFTPVIRPFFENGELTLTVESAMKNEGRFN
jgi:Flp pilus assembly protein TadG